MRNELLPLLCCFGLAAAEPLSVEDRALAAYSELHYGQARDFASVSPKLPRTRLVEALSNVFDRRDPKFTLGMDSLMKLMTDKTVPGEIRAEAKLAYARAAQTVQMRPTVYTEADCIDCLQVYRELILEHPSRPASAFAAIYLAQGLADIGKGEEALTVLKNFLVQYKGDKRCLGAVHYQIAELCIFLKKDYSSAVYHLERMLEYGVFNPRNQGQLLFQIARIYDLYLKNVRKAEFYYNRCIREFPNSFYMPAAKRFLENLSRGKGAAHG